MKQQAPRQECRTGESYISSLANPLAVDKGQLLAARPNQLTPEEKLNVRLSRAWLFHRVGVESVAKRKFYMLGIESRISPEVQLRLRFPNMRPPVRFICSVKIIPSTECGWALC